MNDPSRPPPRPRLLLRYARNLQLTHWMARHSEGDEVVEFSATGRVRFASGAQVLVRPATSWPEALLGFRTQMDTELRPINAAGAILMQAWSTRIHTDVYAWTEGDGWISHRAAAACPICGHRTLSTRGQYEICVICGWEDDGEADHHPNATSRTNNTTPALARGLFWSELATSREGPWWGSLDPEPSFTANDHADALMRVLSGCQTLREERVVMRRALLRLRPAMARRRQAQALLQDRGQGGQARGVAGQRHDTSAESLGLAQLSHSSSRTSLTQRSDRAARRS